MSLGYIPIRDEQVEELVTRCSNLKSLDLKITSINNISLTSIIDNLFETLEELDVSENRDIDFFKLMEVTSMPKLKILNYRQLSIEETQNLTKEFPHLCINVDDLNIATPHQRIRRKGGFWEITAQELEIFEHY